MKVVIFLTVILIIITTVNCIPNGWLSGGQITGLTIINNRIVQMNDTQINCSDFTDCFTKMCFQYRDIGYPNGSLYYERLQLFNPLKEIKEEKIQEDDIPPFSYGIMYVGLNYDNRTIYPRNTCGSIEDCYRGILSLYNSNNSTEFIAIQFFNTTICKF